MPKGFRDIYGDYKKPDNVTASCALERMFYYAASTLHDDKPSYESLKKDYDTVMYYINSYKKTEE